MRRLILHRVVGRLTLVGMLLGAAANLAVAKKKCDSGASEMEINVDNIMPYRGGPASSVPMIQFKDGHCELFGAVLSNQNEQRKRITRFI
jgi:hypothetical protein